MARKTRTKNYKTKKEELMKEIDKSVGRPKKVSDLDNLHNNDPEWYIYDRTMFDSAISMPTLDFKGVKSEWISEASPSISSSYPDKYIGSPTVACMYMNPSASTVRDTGGLDSATSPVNVVARKMYAELSASNAKTSGYAPQDVSTLILALGQIIAYASHLKRAYGITQYYNYYNRTVPRAIMGAYGMNTTGNMTSWTKSMAEIRNRLNIQIARINSIQFPASLNYFKKCAYIYSNIFVDRDDDMPTFLMMAPYSTWIVDETSYEQGTILETEMVYSTTSTNTIGSMIIRLENMLDKVLTSATFNYIYADIINLVNRKVMSEDYIHMDPIAVDYTVEPLYSEQFNWQFMNATIMGAPNGTLGDTITPSNDVYPVVDDNCIRYQPEWIYSRTGATQAMYAISGYNRPVRIPNIDVSDDEFVELLAYYNIPYAMAVGDDQFKNLYYGISDYYAVSLKVFNGTNVIGTDGDYFTANAGLVTDVDVSKISKLLNIVHAPIMSLVAENNTEYIVSKLGTYTFINRKALSNLRAQTYLGLFTVK